jgi:hypothetical protein
MDLSALLLSRLQSVFTLSFHIIFPSFTVGPAACPTVLANGPSRAGGIRGVLAKNFCMPEAALANLPTDYEARPLLLRRPSAERQLRGQRSFRRGTCAAHLSPSPHGAGDDHYRGRLAAHPRLQQLPCGVHHCGRAR